MDLTPDMVVSQVVARLSQAVKGPVLVEGTWGSFARLLTAHISRTLHRPVLHVCPHIDDADRAFDDLKTFGVAGVELLPAWEGEEDLADATDETRSERLRIVSLLADPNGGKHENLVIAAPVQALCQPVPKPSALRESSLELRRSDDLDPEVVVEWLVNNSFERVDAVDLPGQFARRGGIIDIYAPLASEKMRKAPSSTANPQSTVRNPQSQALRIEFFGDTVESIREINLDTQRSTHEIESISIVAAASEAVIEQRELFTNILPEDAIVVFEEPAEVEEVANVFLARIEKAGRLYPWAEIYNSAARYTQLHVCRFAAGRPEEFLKLDVKSIQQFERKATSLWAGHKAALEELIERTKQGSKVFLYCESPAEVQRVTEIMREITGDLPRNFQLPLGYVHQGFVVESLNVIIVSHHELFGQYALRRRERPARATAPVDTLADLQPGEYVVHVSYGIGKYLGTETIEEGSPHAKNHVEGGPEKGGKAEYLTIEYADNVKIQVAVQNIALVQKYIGTSPKRPTLSKVGTKRWQKQKEKVAESVRDLAAELLEVQAKRQAVGGIAYGADSNWQMEFEESFPYQETPDQIGAIREIKADMQEPVAMDRLLCGDVGYGKTELAMRAAFKAVENGKQVAVLVPTTVLSVQHERTFTERFADFPVTVEVLNRFRTGRQAKDVLKRTREGRVDVLIGTHRLLSGDVAFKDLGLLIIDEEQRFGVEHKERLKRMRVNVDILTMTATPIPRTLHMAMLGLRDISSLATAPLDRRSIVTSVTTYNPELIRKAIYRELNRQGQVFFLHNRVQSIEKKAWEIQQLAKDARIGIAHGQMSKRELEDAMVNFVLGAIDVLVCTTIIESGLDIPNANTIFINDADRFGLAEMHQLRGRVGRYKHRAYAYMLLPNTRPISPIAAKRLKAIEEYSHLGAGFRIALRDLEIRGAGNILGPEQSGHIQMVGYQMYCDMLADAVHEMKHEKVERLPTTMIDLGSPTYIPKNYIPIDRHRMDAYRKIAVARTPADLQQIQAELADVYGPLPDEVKLLLDIGELRIAASKWDIRSIVASGNDLVFSFKSRGEGVPPLSSSLNGKGQGQDALATTVKTLFANVRGSVRIPDPKTINLRLAPSYFEPRTLIVLLRKILAGNSG
ncbi:MAG: transcription-repair coupling factor [Phycisphaerae bacterium]|nr:transcription-repair coupling factor [Phycisphaerae bacterium]